MSTVRDTTVMTRSRRLSLPEGVARLRQHALGLLVLASAVLYGITLLGGLATLTSPPTTSPSTLWLDISRNPDGTLRVERVVPGGLLWTRGVAPGDKVIALDGRQPTSEDAGRWTGTSLRVETSRGVAQFDALALTAQHRTWPLLALSPLFFLLGMLVYLRASGPAIGLSAYCLFASAAFALALAPGSMMDSPVAVIGEWATLPIFSASFLLFFMTFPKRLGGSLARTLVILLAALIALLAPLTVAWPALYEPASLLRGVMLLLSLGAGTGLAVFAFVRSSEPDARRGLGVLGVSTIAAVLPFLLLNLAPDLLGGAALVPPETAILGLAVLPAGFAYAILRHRVLDVPLVQRWLVQGLVWGALALAYSVVVYALHRPLGALVEPYRSLVIGLVLVVLASVSFGWLHPRLRETVDRWVFKDSYEYRGALESLSRELSAGGEIEGLGRLLPARLQALMNLDFVVLLACGESGLQVRGVSGTLPEELLHQITSSAEKLRDTQSLPFGYGYLNVLVLPLWLRDQVVGHLCLGPKCSREPYRAADRHLLRTISGHVAAMVRNSQLLEDLKTKVAALDALNERLESAQEEERARVVSDLHDEPLQTAILLQRRLSDDNRPEEDRAISQALVRQLRAICTSTRPPLLDDLGLAAALDNLTVEQTGRSGVPVRLEVGPDVAVARLSSEARLAMYRAAQEALNNALRHAEPRGVQVSVETEEGSVVLTVADDGKGFTPPTQLEVLTREGHLGLAGMQERVRRLGGEVRVASAPGSGTTVSVRVPLERPS